MRFALHIKHSTVLHRILSVCKRARDREPDTGRNVVEVGDQRTGGSTSSTYGIHLRDVVPVGESPTSWSMSAHAWRYRYDHYRYNRHGRARVLEIAYPCVTR